MVIHGTDTNAVEPVFYAVVPDAFMTRESATDSTPRRNAKVSGWADEIDAPILSPHDPWSF